MLDPIVADQLSIEECKRYSRHFGLEEVGIMGQSRLKYSKVLIVGLGGLGSLSSMYLVAAGVGEIGIVDYDIISLSNLQRQVLYDTCLIDKKKAAEAKSRLQKINPSCKVVVFDTKLTTYNAKKIMAKYDIVLDASDNFFTRYLLSDLSILHNIPVVYGAILGHTGQLSVFNYRGGPTYRDLFFDRPQENIALSCSEGGVFGGVAAVVSSLQVNEVMKIILGLKGVVSGKLLIYDFSNSSFRTISLKKRLLYSRNYAVKLLHSLNLEEVNLGFMNKQIVLSEVISQEVAHHLKDETCLLVDVRSNKEYNVMHLTNAQNLPLEQLRNPRVLNWINVKLSQGMYLLVYCSFDSRSITAVTILSEFGINSLRLRGGLKALGF